VIKILNKSVNSQSFNIFYKLCVESVDIFYSVDVSNHSALTLLMGVSFHINLVAGRNKPRGNKTGELNYLRHL
jgi:hypothetical protein